MLPYDETAIFLSFLKVKRYITRKVSDYTTQMHANVKIAFIVDEL